MRKLWLASAVVVTIMVTNDTSAQAPGEIGQQGILTDSLGNPIASGTFELTFRLYAGQEGGSELWSESQTVVVDEGLYAVQLGSSTPINLPFDQQYWLGITVDDGIELSPRLQLTAAPYARRANSVDVVDTESLPDGAVTPSKIATTGADDGQVLIADSEDGAEWAFLNTPSLLDRAVTTKKISALGGATGQILTVGGDTVGWADPEEITGAALPDKSVRAVKLNSQTASPGMVMLAAGTDSVVWGQVGGAGIAPESVTADKISSAGSGNGRVLVDEGATAAWGQVNTGAIVDRAVTRSKISAQGGNAGQVLTIAGDSAAWRDPAGLEPGSVSYDRISAAGGQPGELLGVLEGDTTGWSLVETANLADRAVTAAKISGAGGANGQVLTRAGNGAEWALPVVDPASFADGSVALGKLTTEGASAGNHLIFNGDSASWQDVPALPLPFSGSTDGEDPTSFQITNPITFPSQDPVEDAYSIHGVMSSTTGGPLAAAIRGENRSTSGFGIGVWGSHEGGGWGVYGTASGNGYGIYGASLDGFAGYFSGRVQIIGTLQKSAGSFTIDHPLDPENKTLSHSFVESPDMMNIYNGNVTIGADGTATVTMPEWFNALNRDFRYQLTPIGAPGPNLHVAEEISGNTFRIGGGEPGMRVSWQVTGIRDDAYARANPIVVEEDKPTDQQGRYLNPEAFGLSRERSAAPAQIQGVER